MNAKAKEALARRLDAALRRAEKTRSLPGIQDQDCRRAFLAQLVESVRRISYVSAVSTNRPIADSRADPASELFDPLRAAALRKQQGRNDEAFWFVFLFVHFGKHGKVGWRLARDVYGALGGKVPWDWATVRKDPNGFRHWLSVRQDDLKERGGRFGNHRKYQSLDAWKPSGTGAAFEAYINWVTPYKNHAGLIGNALRSSNDDPARTFRFLYDSMDAVVSFGRMAKFDYLSMVGKLGLAPIEPGSTFMNGATGPYDGAKLLFGGGGDFNATRRELDAWLVDLGATLKARVPELAFTMQVLEDAICNWQKSPDQFMPFRG